jgi:hypothetical protein
MNTIHATHVAVEFPALIGQAAARVLASVLRRGTAAGRSQAPAVALPRGQTHWIDRPLGRVVVCDDGQLWLTFDNQPLDIVLAAGESHHCTNSTRLSVHAMRSSQFRVQ